MLKDECNGEVLIAMVALLASRPKQLQRSEWIKEHSALTLQALIKSLLVAVNFTNTCIWTTRNSFGFRCLFAVLDTSNEVTLI